MEIPMWLTLFALTTQAAAPHEEVQAELFLFDGAGAVLETAEGAPMCNPCTLELSSYATRGAWSLDALAASSGGTPPTSAFGVQAVLLSSSPDVWPAVEPTKGALTPFTASLTWEVASLPSGRVYGSALPYAPEARVVTEVAGATGMEIVVVRAY
jgi:hypothetical protein